MVSQIFYTPKIVASTTLESLEILMVQGHLTEIELTAEASCLVNAYLKSGDVPVCGIMPSEPLFTGHLNTMWTGRVPIKVPQKLIAQFRNATAATQVWVKCIIEV